MPGSFAARSSSCTASSGACIGSMIVPRKRFGYFWCAAAQASLNVRASFSPNSGSAQLTIGLVSEKTRTSIDAFFISLIMVSRSIMSGWKFCTSGTPGSVSVVQPFAFFPSFAPCAGPSSSSSAIHSGGNQWACTSITDMFWSLVESADSERSGAPSSPSVNTPFLRSKTAPSAE